MTRRLDRYILGTLLPALGIFLATFITLFVSVEFASKLGRFLDLDGTQLLPFILRYYTCRLPMMINFLLPAIVLFASIFTLVRLSRNNEILPMVTSGTSLRRVCLPFLVVGVLSGTVILLMDEYVLPRLGEEISDSDDILLNWKVSYGAEEYDGRTKLWARRYDRLRKELLEARVTSLDEKARAWQVVTAAVVRWDPDQARWVAFQGEIESLRVIVEEPGARPRVLKRPIPPGGHLIEALFSPETLRKPSSLASRFAFAPLSKLIEQAERYPHVPSFRMKVHSRLSFPASPVLILLLGVPYVAVAQSKSHFRGMIAALLLALAYYGGHLAFQDLGNSGTLNPAVAVWAPTVGFGFLGLGAYFRMRT